MGNHGYSQGEGPTLSSSGLQSALERIRQAASRDKKLRFTGLWHHVYEVNRLREAYYSLKRRAAPGVDGETWQHYGEDLEENLQDLSGRLKRGAYRAKPVRRAYIPKAGRAATAAGGDRVGGQDCPTSDGGGDECDL